LEFGRGIRDESRWNAIERWQPGTRAITIAATALALLLFWLVLTRFRSGEINAVDFSVYFDRPCYQTIYRARPLFVETADIPSFSNRSELAVHAFWAMFPICAPYAIYLTPYWLLIISIVAVVAGAVHVFRIARELEWGGVLAGSTALAFVLNGNRRGCRFTRRAACEDRSERPAAWCPQHPADCLPMTGREAGSPAESL